jgi:hypothetical protein
MTAIHIVSSTQLKPPPMRYLREFNMLEMGKCKTKFPTFDEWYATLNAEQRQRVDGVLIAEYGE